MAKHDMYGNKGYSGSMSNNPLKGSGSGSKAMVTPSMSNSSSGSITKSNEMRGDVTKKTTNRNPYPGGLS